MSEPKKKPTLAEQILAAQAWVLERALIAYVEDLLGRVPSDDEIVQKGFHVNFSDTPLTVFEKDGQRFTRYFVWDKRHAVAYGFLDLKRPTTLSIVRLPDTKWPPALFAYAWQYGEKEGQ